MRLTAIVFIPVSAVTVAEPPKMSMAETIIFVARLDTHSEHGQCSTMLEDSPKEHEDEVSDRAPARRHDFEPCVCMRSVQLELCCKLRWHDVRVFMCTMHA